MRRVIQRGGETLVLDRDLAVARVERDESLADIPYVRDDGNVDIGVIRERSWDLLLEPNAFAAVAGTAAATPAAAATADDRFRNCRRLVGSILISLVVSASSCIRRRVARWMCV